MRIYVDTDEKFDTLIATLQALTSDDTIAVDTETTGVHLWGGDQLTGIALYIPKTDTAYYVPFRHGLGAFSTDTDDDVKGLSFATKPRRALWTEKVYKQYRLDKEASSENLPIEYLSRLAEVWPVQAAHVMHNAQFDLTVLHNEGFPVPHKVMDTQIGAYLVWTDWSSVYVTMPDTERTERGRLALKWLARYMGLITKGDHGGAGDENNLEIAARELSRKLSVLGNGNTIGLDLKAHMWALPGSVVCDYACQDVEITYALHQKWLTILKSWNAIDEYERLCDVQVQVAWRMHRTGFSLDTDLAKKMIDYATEIIEQHESEAKRLTGLDNFNLGSPKQILDYLHANGMTHIENTDAQTLSEYPGIPLFKILGDYRNAHKLLNTYIAKWLEVVQETYGIIHPEIKIPGTKTGRPSSSSDFVGNFMNIPRVTDINLSPKRLLRPRRLDWQMVEADYSAMEMCVGAWLAEGHLQNEDQKILTNLILSGTDMHAYTRDQIDIQNILLHGHVNSDAIIQWLTEQRMTPGDDVWEQMAKAARYAAKRVNFSMMYRGGVPTIREQLGLVSEQAKAIVDGWLGAYPSVVRAMERFEKEAMKPQTKPDGTGRAFYFPYGEPFNHFYRKYTLYPLRVELKGGKVFNPRQNEARNGFNSAVQGYCGQVCTEAARRISRTFDDDIMNMHITVYDSIIYSVPPTDLYEINMEVKHLMEDNWPVVPGLKADFETAPVGASWGDKQ